jgi:hypothetical protein
MRVGEHSPRRIPECECPASSPDNFGEEAGDLAPVIAIGCFHRARRDAGHRMGTGALPRTPAFQRSLTEKLGRPLT